MKKKVQPKSQNKKYESSLSVLNPKVHFELGERSRPDASIYIIGPSSKELQQKELKSIIKEFALDFQVQELLSTDKKVIHFTGHQGPIWILVNQKNASFGHYGALDESSYGFIRDQIGSVYSQIKPLKEVQIYFSKSSDDIIRACVIGLELAAYQFLTAHLNQKNHSPKVYMKTDQVISKDCVVQAQVEAAAIQLARHLVNLPPNEINPEKIEQLVKKIKLPSTMKIDIWNEKKLQKEKMGLLLAVGAGSETSPRMIHLKYRPKNSKAKKPVAFVGKGITFDTGGLDIKPSSAMRLMKKDMGGSAAVFALAYWCAFSNYSQPCDFYLALAENSVDAKAMRPSDVYMSRAGYSVEIDNTDAEGRLVLADVMDVAVTQKGKDEPEILFDIATLTGAIKVALGADVAGIFSNDDKLAESITTAGQQAAEPNWRIPLVKKYFSGLSSNFADFKNSADGFGGAITAALFLEKFVRNKKWVHMDVYCWNDKPTGALSFAGGSGQPVQTLIQWLKGR